MEKFELGIDKFIKLLKDFEVQENVFNPWKDYDKSYDINEDAPETRRDNLKKFLLTRKDAKCILIAEAPGYQGCHFSGIPMTSERLIITNAYNAFSGMERSSCKEKLKKRAKTVQEDGFCEPTATIIWKQMIEELKLNSNNFVLWNAFAFHPYKNSTNILTNRKPTKEEIQANKKILKKIISLFPNAKIISVGNVSDKSLKDLGITNIKKVRHPSYGGAKDFREGITKILK